MKLTTGTAGRSRGRVVMTFADQIISSASNFIIGVAVARFSGAAEFGEYMLVLLVWLAIVGAHRRLITEPMIIRSGGSDAEADYVAHGLGAELLVGACASLVIGAAGAVVLAAGGRVGATMLAIAPWFAPLLIQDYWRAIAFQRRRPDLALMNDATFGAVQVGLIAGFAAMGFRTAPYMIAAWGAGALAGSILGFVWFPTVPRGGDGLRLLRSLWPRSRWLLADFVTAFASQQAYVAFAALLLSKVEYGGFRAASSLMGPTIVILLASSNIGLPETSRRVDKGDADALHKYVRRLTAGTLLWVAMYCTVLAVAARPILGALYGPEFRRFAPLAVLTAIQYVIIVTVFGEGIALRATGQIRRLWRPRLLIGLASLGSLVLFIHLFGTAGAGWSGVATFSYEALATYVIYRACLGAPDTPHLSADDGSAAALAAVATTEAVLPGLPPILEDGTHP